MPAETIVILGTAEAGPTLAVGNFLLERFPGCQIIYEQRESRENSFSGASENSEC